MYQISWSYKQLWAAVWVLRIDLRSPGLVASTLIYWAILLCNPGWIWIHYVAQAVFKRIMIFLSLPPKYWIRVQVLFLILTFVLLKVFFFCCIYLFCVWGGETYVYHILWEMVLSFHQVGSRDRTRIIKLGGKHLHPLSHLGWPMHALVLLTTLNL